MFLIVLLILPGVLCEMSHISSGGNFSTSWRSSMSSGMFHHNWVGFGHEMAPGLDLETSASVSRVKVTGAPAGPRGTIWYNGTFQYLPALPGQQPACTGGGTSVCRTVYNYPVKKVRALLDRYKIDFSTLFEEQNMRPDVVPDSLYATPAAVVDTRTVTVTEYSTINLTPLQPPRARFSQHSPLNKAYNYPPPRQTLDYLGTATSIRTTSINPTPSLYNYLPPPTAYSYTSSRRSKRQKRQLLRDETKLCPTSTERTTLQVGGVRLGDTMQWRYVVNDVSFPVQQMVSLENCRRDGGQCGRICTVPADSVAECRQGFVTQKLLVLRPDGVTLDFESVELPVSCSCTVISDL